MRVIEAAFWQAHFCLPERERVSARIEVDTPSGTWYYDLEHINLKGALQNSRDSQASANQSNLEIAASATTSFLSISSLD